MNIQNQTDAPAAIEGGWIRWLVISLALVWCGLLGFFGAMFYLLSIHWIEPVIDPMDPTTTPAPEVPPIVAWSIVGAVTLICAFVGRHFAQKFLTAAAGVKRA